jgi:hypothetical protein
MMTYIVYRRDRDPANQAAMEWTPVYLLETESVVHVLEDAMAAGVTCRNDQALKASPAIYASKADLKAAQLATDAVLGERGDAVGQVDCWRVGDVYFVAELFRHGRGLDYDTPPRRLQADAEQDLQECLGMMTQLERDRAAVESYVQAYRITSVDEGGGIGSAVSK